MSEETTVMEVEPVGASIVAPVPVSPRPAPTPVAAPVAKVEALESRPKRERKSVEVYKPPEQKTTKKEVSIQSGSGMQLGDYKYFAEGFDKLKTDSEACIALHSICFGQVGTKNDRKKNLRKFSGFSESIKAEQVKVSFTMFTFIQKEINDVRNDL
jgi:hypothetical protein